MANVTRAEQEEAASKVTPLEVIEAFQAETGQLSRRIHDLERRLSRFDHIFEHVFREEADRRLQGKKNCESDRVCEVSPLERLKMKSAKLRAQ